MPKDPIRELREVRNDYPCVSLPLQQGASALGETVGHLGGKAGALCCRAGAVPPKQPFAALEDEDKIGIRGPRGWVQEFGLNLTERPLVQVEFQSCRCCRLLELAG